MYFCRLKQLYSYLDPCGLRGHSSAELKKLILDPFQMAIFTKPITMAGEMVRSACKLSAGAHGRYAV